MRMKEMFLSVVLLGALLASSFEAYSIRIDVGGVSYEGRGSETSVEYRAGGRTVGYAKASGNDVIYTDDRHAQIGRADKNSDGWTFRAGNGAIIGYVRFTREDSQTYEAGSRAIIGYAERIASRTLYRAGNQAEIGNADTVSMPLRPIPLEHHLKNFRR